MHAFLTNEQIKKKKRDVLYYGLFCTVSFLLSLPPSDCLQVYFPPQCHHVGLSGLTFTEAELIHSHFLKPFINPKPPTPCSLDCCQLPATFFI